jgi:host factor-I protein
MFFQRWIISRTQRANGVFLVAGLKRFDRVRILRGNLMGRISMNLQDSFLNQVRKDGGEVRVIMLDGAEMVGQVRGFDNFTLIIACEGVQSLVYKHAIARMVATRLHSRQENKSAEEAGTEETSEDDKSPKKKPGFNTIDLSQIKLAEKQS